MTTRVPAPVTVGLQEAERITGFSYARLLQALHATEPHSPLAGKRIGDLYKIKVTDLLAWAVTVPELPNRAVVNAMLEEERLSVRVFDLKAAAPAYGVSRDRLRAEIVAGNLRAKRLGEGTTSKYLVSVTDLDAWFDGLPDA